MSTTNLEALVIAHRRYMRETAKSCRCDVCAAFVLFEKAAEASTLRAIRERHADTGGYCVPCSEEYGLELSQQPCPVNRALDEVKQ